MSSSNLEGVDLGEWLKKFPKCYGEGFDYERNAIETAPTPSYSIKTYGLFTTTQRYLLSIIYVPASTWDRKHMVLNTSRHHLKVRTRA